MNPIQLNNDTGNVLPSSAPKHPSTQVQDSPAATVPRANEDIISINNLQLPHPITAPDVWGRLKEQPALISVTLSLSSLFQSAASKDALDDSTIHYGDLAKRIRARCAKDQDVGQVLALIEGVISEMGMKLGGRFVLRESSVGITLPKATMFGEGLRLWRKMGFNGKGEVVQVLRGVVVEGVRVPTLVGVNACERQGRQPVVATLTIILRLRRQHDEKSHEGEIKVFFGLEEVLVQAIQETAFETLESLANFTVARLQERALSRIPNLVVRLRLEKPRALPFADCPAVEVVREMPLHTTGPTSESKREVVKLKIIKPYVR